MVRFPFFLFLIIGFHCSFAQNDTCLAHSELGISFPPVADAVQRDFAQLHLDALDIQRIRFGEDWALREPSPGNYNWGPLDQRIAWATQNQYPILLTIQSRGPAWACGQSNPQSCVVDNMAFRAYMDALLMRYPNQIDKIQFGNEWQTTFWYVGNAQEFIASNHVVYDAVQAHSPTTQVVLGGFTTSSLRYMAACNGYVNGFYEDDGSFLDSSFLATACTSAPILAVKARIDSILSQAKYDVLDLHLYDDVEQWDEYYANFTDTITKPIIVSEFGGPNMNVEPYTPTYQAHRVYEYIRKLDSLEIPEIYFFKLVEGTANSAHITSGLIDDTTLTLKPAYGVVEAFENCTAIGVEEKWKGQLQLFPNPAREQCTVDLGNVSPGVKSLRIYNEMGQLIFQRDRLLGTEFTFSTRTFPSGLYYLVVGKDEEQPLRGQFSVVQ